MSTPAVVKVEESIANSTTAPVHAPPPVNAPSTAIPSVPAPTIAKAGGVNPGVAAAPAVSKLPVAKSESQKAVSLHGVAPTHVTVAAPVSARPAPVPASVPSPVIAAPAPAVAQAAAPTARTTSKSKKKKAQPTVTMATAATAQSNSQGSHGENTGRWTAEEHRLFLQGLELHGKGWKKIASLIKSRTVVQIRTHAQKYFQKLAKARQNGEEGDVAMEGRGGTASVAAVSPAAAAQSNKRRRQTTGTKRKAIQSVVSSAQREGKKMAVAAASTGQNPPAPIPTAAPALAHFLLPNAPPPTANNTTAATNSCVPSITTAQGTISGPALEDSLFRFLTPAPVAAPEPQVNEVARQAGANPITVPSESPSTAPSVSGGEVSPTGVADLAIYPSWTDAKDTPSWYAKGADVDALLEVGDTLDWLADTGDLHETYQPPVEVTPTPAEEYVKIDIPAPAPVPTLNGVDSCVESVVPPLPSLFDGTTDASVCGTDPTLTVSAAQLTSSVSAASIDEHLQVFDTPMEEHDFVSTILENTSESTESLPVLA